MTDELLTIGELAGRAGRRASSIRYYEQIGLLPEPIRISGQRRYRDESLRTLAVIDTGQRAGLTLDEIKALLDAASEDEDAIEELRRIASRKLPELTAMIERATLVKGWLEAASRCQCPSLDDSALFAEDAPLDARCEPGGTAAEGPFRTSCSEPSAASSPRRFRVPGRQ